MPSGIAGHSKTLETSERVTRGVESGDERDYETTPSSDRENERDRQKPSRSWRVVASEETSGVDDEETTGVIELNLAEVRRALDELCKKE